MSLRGFGRPPTYYFLWILPRNLFSRFCGIIADAKLPGFILIPLILLFSRFYGIDLNETIKKVSELRKRHIELESQFVLGVDDILNAEQLATLGFLKHKMLRDVKDELGNRSKKNNRKNKIKKRGGRKSRGF